MYVFQAIPEWYRAEALKKEPLQIDSVLYPFVDFAHGISADQKQILLSSAGLKTPDINLKSTNSLLKIFTNESLGSPDFAEYESFVESYTKDGYFFVKLSPRIYVYYSGVLVGNVSITKEKSSFQEKPSQGLFSLYWLNEPKIILPKIETSNTLSEHLVSVQSSEEGIELGKLLSQISAQMDDFKVAGIDENLSKKKLYISAGEWKLGALLKGISLCLGVEVRDIAGQYFLGTSLAHREVADLLVNKEVSEIRMNNIKKELDFIYDAMKKDFPTWDIDRFRNNQVVSVSELTNNEKIVLRSAGVDLTKPNLQFSFVLNIALTLRKNEGGKAGAGMTGFASLSPYAFNTNLIPEEDQDLISPSFYKKSFGATVDFEQGEKMTCNLTFARILLICVSFASILCPAFAQAVVKTSEKVIAQSLVKASSMPYGRVFFPGDKNAQSSAILETV